MLHELLQQHNEKNPFPDILASGTDGTDGPTDAAGAIIDASTVEQVGKENIPVEEYLRNNDSYNFFIRTNSLFVTGPTDTNVMDIVIGLIA
jgi:hydroxypyruvate reductase